MVEVTIRLPDNIARTFGETPEKMGRHLLENAAIEEYRAGRLSHRQVGEMLGLDYWQAEHFLTKHRVPLKPHGRRPGSRSSYLGSNLGQEVSVVVSDTGPLHYLILCDAQQVLPQLFAQVIIPPTVLRELQHPNTPPAVRDWVQSLPPWVKIQAPTALDLTLHVDPGELEAICLAKEINAAAVLMDDRAGRNAARRYGLFVTGTPGILELAAARGLVQLGSAIGRLQQTTARLDLELMQAALERDRASREQEHAQPISRRIEPQR